MMNGTSEGIQEPFDLIRLSLNERDLIRVVVEVIHELRDPADEEEHQVNAALPLLSAYEFIKVFFQRDDSVSNVGETPATVRTVRAPPKPIEERTPEEQAQADTIDLRCLALCIGMLERVHGVGFIM